MSKLKIQDELIETYIHLLLGYGHGMHTPTTRINAFSREDLWIYTYRTDSIFRAKVDTLVAHTMLILDRYDVLNYPELLDSYQAVQEDLVMAQHKIKELEKQLDETNK